MKCWFHLTIAKKLVIGILLGLLTVGGCVVGWQIYVLKQGHLRAAQWDARMVSIHFEERMSEMLRWGASFQEAGKTESEASSIFLHPDLGGQIQQVGIVDATGLVMSHSDIRVVGQPLPSLISQLPIREDTPQLIPSKTSYDFFVPLFYEQLQGYVLVGFAPEVVERPISITIKSASIVASLLFLFLAICLTWVLHHRLKKRLAQLENHIVQIRETGDLQRSLVYQQSDELGKTTQQMLLMQQALRKQEFDMLSKIHPLHEQHKLTGPMLEVLNRAVQTMLDKAITNDQNPSSQNELVQNYRDLERRIQLLQDFNHNYRVELLRIKPPQDIISTFGSRLIDISKDLQVHISDHLRKHPSSHL